MLNNVHIPLRFTEQPTLCPPNSSQQPLGYLSIYQIIIATWKKRLRTKLHLTPQIQPNMITIKCVIQLARSVLANFSTNSVSTPDV